MASFSASIIFSFFAASIICFISATHASSNGGITVDLIHRDSPNSPFFNASESFANRFRKSIHRSNSRYTWLESAVLKKLDAFEAPITHPAAEYLMKIKIGTPPAEVIAIADTGSDLTWTQCKPCVSCYPQDAPLFDPTKSSTFQAASCSDSLCQSLGNSGNGCDDQNNCLYQISYGDKSYTRGNLGTETFGFESSSGGESTFASVTFGCSRNSKGTFTKDASGIIGLGGGATSIVRQLGKSVGGIFSYCLTPPGSDAVSKISFGPNAVVRGPGVQKTPLETQDTFYFLNLEAITVGDDKIENTASKPAQAGANGNIIIDSGTTLTYLPSDLYTKLISSLKQAVKGTPVQGDLDLCYEEGSITAVPPITAHFSGADVRLSGNGTFLSTGEGVVCATFAASDGLGLAIFGNLHQINYRIGYDIDGQQLSFLPTDCSRSE